MDVTITYDTPTERIDQAVDILRCLLHDPTPVENRKFDMEDYPPRIAFNEFNADSLNICSYYWYQMARAPDRGLFSCLNPPIGLHPKLFHACAEAGIDFAFPGPKARCRSHGKSETIMKDRINLLQRHEPSRKRDWLRHMYCLSRYLSPRMP